MISFLFNAPPTPELYTLSLHDALPISLADADPSHREHDIDCALGGKDDHNSRRRPRRRAGPGVRPGKPVAQRVEDRKSTRLNSSHVEISYAVFCLKKKKIRETS